MKLEYALACILVTAPTRRNRVGLDNIAILAVPLILQVLAAILKDGQQ